MRIQILFVFILAFIFKTICAQEMPDSDMVLIPGGEFEIGKSSQNQDYSPAHKVLLDSFWMDKFEVTNADYLKFCKETGYHLPEFWGMDVYKSGPDFPNYPVIGVNWYDSNKYAKWAGKRLPTEAEWEVAARGGIVDNEFPNGNDLDTTLAYINAKRMAKGPTEVGSFQPNNFGLYDMAGNVWEWVADKYSPNYYADSLFVNPINSEIGRFRVFRGGGWHSGKSCNRVYYRNALPANWCDFAGGFRCVKDIK